MISDKASLNAGMDFIYSPLIKFKSSPLEYLATRISKFIVKIAFLIDLFSQIILIDVHIYSLLRYKF